MWNTYNFDINFTEAVVDNICLGKRVQDTGLNTVYSRNLLKNHLCASINFINIYRNFRNLVGISSNTLLFVLLHSLGEAG